MSENAVKRAVGRYLALLGRDVWFFKVWGSARQDAGIPDIVGVYKGRFFGLELKAPGARGATPIQMHRLAQIRQAGGLAGVARSVDDVKRILVGS